MVKKILIGVASILMMVGAFGPAASAATIDGGNQDTAAAPREGSIPFGDFNTLPECQDAGNYNVMVGTHGATNFHCKQYLWIPSSDPRCNNNTNDDGCIGEWWGLYLLVP